MSASALQKSLLSSTAVTGTLFAAATVPLIMHSSDVVEVQLQNQPLFDSEVRSLAGPYLGVVGTVSAAVGLGVLGISGWRNAARHSYATQAKVAELQQDLQRQKTELEQIKFSSARLKAQKLDTFLEAPAAPAAPAVPATPAATAIQVNPSANTEKAVKAFASAQPYASYAPRQAAPAPSQSAAVTEEPQMEQLLHQLQELALKVREMRVDSGANGHLAA